MNAEPEATPAPTEGPIRGYYYGAGQRRAQVHFALAKPDGSAPGPAICGKDIANLCLIEDPDNRPMHLGCAEEIGRLFPHVFEGPDE